jgi:hypothetical protein
MKKQEIIEKIENIVNYYSVWTIGITSDPAQRKKVYGNPASWTQWKADCEQIARDVEMYFLDKGMNGRTEVGKSPNYVYIFM